MTWAITPENVAGLVVGEGCFYAESATDPKYKSGWGIRPGFCIEMRYDERPVLDAVEQHLGCGAIYDLDFGRYKGYENRGWHPHAKYRVTRLADLHDLVIPFFRQFPLFGRKAEAFDLFASLVQLLFTKTHRDTDGLVGAKLLAAELSDHNTRGRRAVRVARA